LVNTKHTRSDSNLGLLLCVHNGKWFWFWLVRKVIVNLALND
jgi:hypothetical protein